MLPVLFHRDTAQATRASIHAARPALNQGMQMFKKSTVLMVIIALLAGCAQTGTINRESAGVREQASNVNKGTRQVPLPIAEETTGTPANVDAKAAYALQAPVAKRATKAWIGARMVTVQSDEVLPPIFSDPFKLNFDDRATGGRVSISVIAERISRITNVPVRVKSDVFAPVKGGAVDVPSLQPQGLGVAPLPAQALPSPLPPGRPNGASPLTPVLPGATVGQAGQPAPQPAFRQPVTDVSSVDMQWNGSLSSFLDHVTGRLNLSWSYRDGVVVIERFITENFELSAFVGSQDFKMTLGATTSGQTGENGNTGGANSAMDVNEAGKIAALESLRKSIETMVASSGGEVVLSEGSGRLTVTATRDVMGRVREVVKQEDAVMLRQAHIQFDIYSVTTDDNDQKGVDWNLVLSNVAKTWNMNIKSPTALGGQDGGTFGYSILAPTDGTRGRTSQAQYGGSRAVLTLLYGMSNTAQYRPVSMIAMNRQWARKTNLKSDGYLSETTPATASSVGSGAPGLKTSSIVTGDKFMVQPAIMDNGAILLKFGISLTELLSLFEVTAGSGPTFQRVQTPVTSGTDDQTTIRLQPGEVMAVTGLSRRLSKADSRSLADGVPMIAGGSRTAQYKREDFLILVRAVQL
jgi:type IVB pilus formation R64 PilN family outer membrane protein